MYAKVRSSTRHLCVSSCPACKRARWPRPAESGYPEPRRASRELERHVARLHPEFGVSPLYMAMDLRGQKIDICISDALLMWERLHILTLLCGAALTWSGLALRIELPSRLIRAEDMLTLRRQLRASPQSAQQPLQPSAPPSDFELTRSMLSRMSDAPN